MTCSYAYYTVSFPFFRRNYDKLVHISDWYPTILKLAQVNNLEEITRNIDGLDQTLALFEDDTSVNPRTMVVNELGNVNTLHKRGVLQIEGGWKLLKNAQRIAVRDRYELYNVIDDPSETMDLKDDFPEIFEGMKAQIEVLLQDMIPEDHPQIDPTAQISDGHGNLATGWC